MSLRISALHSVIRTISPRNLGLVLPLLLLRSSLSYLEIRCWRPQSSTLAEQILEPQFRSTHILNIPNKHILRRLCTLMGLFILLSRACYATPTKGSMLCYRHTHPNMEIYNWSYIHTYICMCVCECAFIWQRQASSSSIRKPKGCANQLFGVQLVYSELGVGETQKKKKQKVRTNNNKNTAT